VIRGKPMKKEVKVQKVEEEVKEMIDTSTKQKG
jgi:hypothetical protein